MKNKIILAEAAADARGYNFYSYIRAMDKAFEEQDKALYERSRSLLRAQFEHINERLCKLERI